MKTNDMTTGNEAKKILLFTLPIFLGNLFQQIYGMSDTVVVGRFLGEQALAAVGASVALTVFINSILIGLCMGSGILFAELYGSKDYKTLSRAISTASIFVLGITLVITVISIVFLNQLIYLFQIPTEAFQLTKDYLLIILAGLVFMFMYNMASAILRAMGDSKTPLIFLIVSSVINVAFDFILVIYTDLGVKGPALSTFAAQLFSGVPMFIYVIKKLKFLELKPVFDKGIFKRVANYSILTSLQQSIMNFGILMVQGLVNSFGVVAMAAFAIGVKVDTFAYMPAQDFGNAFATFVAQNKGAEKYDRIKKGFKSSIICVTIFCFIISVAVYMFAPNLIGLFSPGSSNVVEAGSIYLRTEGLFYILIGYLFLLYGFYRGMGNFKMSIILTIISLGLRVALSYIFVGLGFGLTSIWWSIVIGWVISDIIGFIKVKESFAICG